MPSAPSVIREVQLKSDAYARATLVRGLVPAEDRESCAWCGWPGKFIYQWEQGCSIRWRPFGYTADRVFCSVSCWQSYYH